jgi:hypothetical protein
VHFRALSILTGKRDIISGLVFNVRPEKLGGDELLGMYLNVLPLRMEMKQGTWLELAKEVEIAEKALLRYRRYPLSKLKSDLGGEDLFDCIFNYTHFSKYAQRQEDGKLLFQRGAFDAAATESVARLLRIFMAALVGITIGAVAGYFGRLIDRNRAHPAPLRRGRPSV